ncbi:MAG: Succinyl-diaminopimelate desuccinylase [Chlamydiae bacterium]|nr:Succinyl-diaminopimelate desuccinylase [Chlamydiota bacterium]
MSLSAWENWFSNHREKIFQDFFHFLTFKSIGTDPTFDRDTKACASWLAEYLKECGMETALWETSGQPVVFATHCKAENRPTLLVYQHYDVQPVDPLELWESDPFEPTVRDGKVYARGAQDNKGQCFYSITAIKALLELCGELNFNLKLFIEGEEERGSEGTRAAIEAKKEELKCDYMLAIDSTIPDAETPAITLGLRGIITMEITCKGADVDMHSGALGGVAYNPIRALATALSTCWNSSGKVAIPHFYDAVEEMSEDEAKNFVLEMTKKR